MSQALDSRPFLAQAPFQKSAFKVWEIGLKQPPISADVVVVGAQTGEFLVGHGASVWMKEIYSREQKRLALTFNVFMKESFVPGRLIVNKIETRQFTPASLRVAAYSI
jgi:hypothetical protein